MDRYILSLVLLILIAAGILYIFSRKIKEPLDTLSNKCLKGCQPATVVTGNCQPYGKVNNKLIHSCPQECITENLNRLPYTCSYDGDCKFCKRSLLYSNGRPYYPNGNGGYPPNGPPSVPGSRGVPPSAVPASPGTPPSSINLPTAAFSPTKNNGASDLCPASTIIIIER